MSFSILWHKCLALVTLAVVLQSGCVQVCFGKELSTAARGAGSSKGGSTSVDGRSAGKAAVMEPGWRLRQRGQFDGMFTVSITKQAITITGDRLDYRLLLKAPQWRVLMINDRSRTMHEVSSDKWISPFGQSFNALSRIRFDNAKLVDKGREQFQSVSCRNFEVIPPKEAETAIPAKTKYKHSVANDGKFLVCDKLGVPTKACTFLCKRFGLPNAPGVPMSFVCKNEVGRREMLLLTLRLKKTSFPASEFEVPKYKLVKSTKEMMMNSEKMEAINDLVDGLDSHLER